MSADNASVYSTCAELKGAKGAINVLIFSRDGKLLLSGGDDKCVRVWSTDDYRCSQTIESPKWGQVTALTWIWAEPPTHASLNSVCVGTGRGCVSVCPVLKTTNWVSWKDAYTSTVFEFNDAVEAQAYDPLNQRLVLASHSGQIKMFEVEKCTFLKPLWTTAISNAIPRSLHFFGGANQSLLTHSLETGEMCCRDAQNANILWTKNLTGGIGHAALSPDETIMLVDNLTSGNFDIYRFPGSTPTNSFTFTSTRHFIKQCLFAEGGKVAVCGSDTSRVHVADVATGKTLQVLSSGKGNEMLQTVAASDAGGRRFLIAGGSSSADPVVYLWEKIREPKKSPKGQKAISDKKDCPPSSDSSTLPDEGRQTAVNGFFALLIILLSYPHWSQYLRKLLAILSIVLAYAASLLASFSGTPDGLHAPDVHPVVPQSLAEIMKEGRWMDMDKVPRAIDIAIEERNTISRQRYAETVKERSWVDIAQVPRAVDVLNEEQKALKSGPLRNVDDTTFRDVPDVVHAPDAVKEMKESRAMTNMVDDVYFHLINEKTDDAEGLKAKMKADKERLALD